MGNGGRGYRATSAYLDEYVRWDDTQQFVYLSGRGFGKAARQQQQLKELLMHQGRDIDLRQWLDGIGFHPANTELKQVGHELARQLVALLGTHLHMLLPAGRDKSLAFTHLEDVLMRANRALALGDGPPPTVVVEDAKALLANLKEILSQLGSGLPDDARIEAYKAAQRNA